MKKLLTFFFLATCSVATAQDTIRVCTYNLLNYSKTNEDGRSVKFKRIFDVIVPDIVVVQELTDEESNAMLSLIGSPEHPLVPINFHNGPDTDNGLYYNFKKLEFLKAQYYPTYIHDIAQYTLRVISTGDTLHVFSVHFSTGTGDEPENNRYFETRALLYEAPSLNNEKTILAGVFNFSSYFERGVSEITARYIPEETPRFHDPLGFSQWERNSTKYLGYYTESTRTSFNANCGGGVGGGLDDRLDIIYFSKGLKSNFINGSYTVFGNDGQNRLDSSISSPPNTKVSAEIAADLECASDHLPVYADFIFGAPTSIEENLLQEIVFKETSENISVSLPSLGFVTITDILGRILVKENISSRWDFKKDYFTGGMYFIKATSGRNSQQFKFITSGK